MWTLRDLWMMLNPQYAQQWREQQAGKYNKKHTSQNDWESIGLQDIISRKSPWLEDAMNRSRPNIYGPEDMESLMRLYNWREQPKGMT